MADNHANGLRGFMALGRFLANEGQWQPQRVPDTTIYRATYSGQYAHYLCLAQVLADLELLLFYAVFPVHAPPPRRQVVAEFITRANFGLRLGNLEFDFEDGEIRYKTSLDFEGEILSDNLLRNTIYPAVLTLDHFYPGLLSVINGARTPREAIDDLQSPGEDSDDD